MDSVVTRTILVRPPRHLDHVTNYSRSPFVRHASVIYLVASAFVQYNSTLGRCQITYPLAKTF